MKKILSRMFVLAVCVVWTATVQGQPLLKTHVETGDEDRGDAVLRKRSGIAERY